MKRRTFNDLLEKSISKTINYLATSIWIHSMCIIIAFISTNDQNILSILQWLTQIVTKLNIGRNRLTKTKNLMLATL